MEDVIFGCKRFNSYQSMDLSHEPVLMLKFFPRKSCIKKLLSYKSNLKDMCVVSISFENNILK